MAAKASGHEQRTMKINLPTALTLLRLLIVPWVVVLLCLEFSARDAIVAAAFALAVATDWFDGWLARRWNQTSAFGAFLDPVADKLLVCVVLVMLVYQEPFLWIALPAVVIVGREITVSALREWMAELGERAAIAVGALGKYKTTIQMGAMLLMLYDLSEPRIGLYWLGVVSLWIAALLTIYSMVRYLQTAWLRLQTQEQDKTPKQRADLEAPR
ncbi:MAG: CDP-diacylglycerol--glycerol-3-phosphate 3-phosphatidyltransferase [Salinisphaera sp.]|nr:CDP-diacylglycerol--glycerol-3-phosphate 3-phosphatidyltransferase [Salinisphaera sp.]